MPDRPKKSVRETIATLPEIWALVRPRRGLLAAGFALMAVNRVCGLVLPASTKFLIDDVIGKRQSQSAAAAGGRRARRDPDPGRHLVSADPTLSKAAQRLIAELRRKVQEHVGRLPVAYYDANKTGTLVSRIMSDVEGVRNLIGTGLVEFVGGLLTAAIALVVLLRISPLMTGVALACPRGVRPGAAARRSAPSGRSSASAARSTPR